MEEKNKGDQFNLDLTLGSPFSILWAAAGRRYRTGKEELPLQGTLSRQDPLFCRIPSFPFPAQSLGGLLSVVLLVQGSASQELEMFLITPFRGSSLGTLDLQVYNPFLLKFI